MVNGPGHNNACRTVNNNIHEPISLLQIPIVTRTNPEHMYPMKGHAVNRQKSNGKKSVNLQLYHQNIRGLHNKIEELTTQWTKQCPHLLCFTEHHLKESEINNIHIKNYKLGASYCRLNRTHGEVGIFVHNT